MENKRRKFNGSFKAKVALAAVKGDRTMSELASAFGVHANQITKWKRQLLDGLPGIFSERHREDVRQQETLTDRLYQQIGQLKVELDWLKKNLVLTLEEKRAVVEPRHPTISLRRQCDLLDLSRSSLYYRCEADLSYNEQLMRLLDEQYLQTPFYGVPRMTAWLRRQGHTVNEKRVRRLLRAMGLEAIYPRQKQGLSQADRQHQVYPYLLRGLEITRPNQVWAADITYIRMARGWVYLMAILDWFSRYVVTWELSITLEADFCVTTLQRALSRGRPEIFNTDQGSQFTSDGWIDTLKDAQVAISMDGRGRVFDNIFTERLWRSVKVEEVYLHDYQTVREVRDGLGWYFPFYNEERPHQALGDCTPAEVYTGVERRGGSLAPLRSLPPRIPRRWIHPRNL